MQIKGLLVELELLADARVIQVKMYAKNARGLVGQVACAVTTASGICVIPEYLG
jgi:hypothetical protein